MLPSEKFGFIGPMAWLADQDSWVVLLVCMAITPGLPLLIAPLLEARWLPLDNRLQFKAFFPGDLYLSACVASLLALGRYLPDGQYWYSSWWLHVVVAAGALTVAVALTVMEVKAPTTAAYAWPMKARTSPTKLYHNFALYGGYGYLAVTTLIACLFGGLWWQALVAVAIAGPWLYFLSVDNKAPEKVRVARLRYAHIADWRPLWANGWHVRSWKEL